MEKILGFFKGLDKKQLIIIAVVTVVVIGLIITGIILLANGNGNDSVESKVETLKVTSAKLSETEPVKITAIFTFENDKIIEVRFEDTYNDTEAFEKDVKARSADKEKFFEIGQDVKTRTLSYNVSDLSTWKDYTYDSLKKKYEEDYDWNIIVDENAPTKAPETTTKAKETKAKETKAKEDK